MKIFNRIAALRADLSEGALRVADVILEEREQISDMTSSGLAERAGVSQSAVVKFVQKLGYDGMTAFRLAVREEMGRRRGARNMAGRVPLHNEITSEDDAPTIAQKLMQEKVQAVVETTNEIDFRVLAKVVDRINAARLVHITGLGGSFQVTSDLAHKLLKIGIIALVDADSHVQLATANTLGPQDIQIAVSYSGRTKEILEAARVARSRNARVLAITSPTDNPLHDLADFSLFTLADEARRRSSAISSRTAQSTVTDLIFMMLIQTKPERNDRITEINSLVNRLTQ